MRRSGLLKKLFILGDHAVVANGIVDFHSGARTTAFPHL